MICARASIDADTGASLFYISFAEAEYFRLSGTSTGSARYYPVVSAFGSRFGSGSMAAQNRPRCNQGKGSVIGLS